MFGLKDLRERVEKLYSEVRELNGWRKGYVSYQAYPISWFPQLGQAKPARPLSAEGKIAQLEEEIDLLLEYLQVEKQTTPGKTAFVKVKRG